MGYRRRTMKILGYLLHEGKANITDNQTYADMMIEHPRIAILEFVQEIAEKDCKRSLILEGKLFLFHVSHQSPVYLGALRELNGWMIQVTNHYVLEAFWNSYWQQGKHKLIKEKEKEILQSIAKRYDCPLIILNVKDDHGADLYMVSWTKKIDKKKEHDLLCFAANHDSAEEAESSSI